MPRTRDLLTPFVIYTDGDRAFLTPDCQGGDWADGDADATAAEKLAEEYGEETEVVELDAEHMKRIANDWDEECYEEELEYA